MSDFLSNLLDRTLGEAPSIQRYRPSLFEPVAEPASAVAEAPVRMTAEPSPDAPAAPPPAPFQVASEPPPPPPAAATVMEPPIAAPIPRAATPPAPEVRTPPAHIITHHHETRIERQTRRVDTIIERPSPAPAPPVMERPDANPRTEAALVEPQPRAAPAPRAPAPNPPVTIIQPAPAQAPPRRAPTPVPPAAPIITRVSQAPPPSEAPPPAPAPIEITIGRLEIRATQPAPSAPRPRSSRGPALGLDAYLRQRGGGTP